MIDFDNNTYTISNLYSDHLPFKLTKTELHDSVNIRISSINITHSILIIA